MVRRKSENSVSYNLNNGFECFFTLTFLILLVRSLLLESVGIVSISLKVLSDFKTNIFKVELFIIITFIPFPMNLVLVLDSIRSSTCNS